MPTNCCITLLRVSTVRSTLAMFWLKFVSDFSSCCKSFLFRFRSSLANKRHLGLSTHACGEFLTSMIFKEDFHFFSTSILFTLANRITVYFFVLSCTIAWTSVFLGLFVIIHKPYLISYDWRETCSGWLKYLWRIILWINRDLKLLTAGLLLHKLWHKLLNVKTTCPPPLFLSLSFAFLKSAGIILFFSEILFLVMIYPTFVPFGNLSISASSLGYRSTKNYFIFCTCFLYLTNLYLYIIFDF